MPPLGELLGDFIDEIKDRFKSDAFGDSFCSIEPKSYCLRIQTKD